MVTTAVSLGLLACPSCRLVSRAPDGGRAGCPRCGAVLHARKPASLERTSALLVAASVLLLPANLLPVITTRKLFTLEPDTIWSGVVSLWKQGSWSLALLVFTASIAVPVLKIATLSFLVVSTRRGSTWRQRERTQLYRLVEFIGRWSMMDVFVMGLLAAIVHTRLLGVQINVGAIAFAAVVVLTMLSSLSFDPRLIWDQGDDRRE